MSIQKQQFSTPNRVPKNIILQQAWVQIPTKKKSVLVKILQQLHTLFNEFFKLNHQKFLSNHNFSISNFLHSNHKKFSFSITIFLIFTLIGFYCFPGFTFRLIFFFGKLFDRSRFPVTLSSVKWSEKVVVFSETVRTKLRNKTRRTKMPNREFLSFSLQCSSLFCCTRTKLW